MPLTAKGEEIKEAMEEQYGTKKGEQVFYASANKGTITGVHEDTREGDVKVVDGIAYDAVSEYEYKQVGPPGLTADEINRRADEYWRQKLPAPEQSTWTYPAPGTSPRHQ